MTNLDYIHCTSDESREQLDELFYALYSLNDKCKKNPVPDITVEINKVLKAYQKLVA